MNLSNVVSNQREEEILFNVFNIFKVLSVKDGENEGRKIVIIELQYCGHIDLITKNFEEKTDDFEKNILENIMRFNKSKDAFELLKEEGKKKEMLKVIYEKIDGDVELKPDETIAFT